MGVCPERNTPKQSGGNLNAKNYRRRHDPDGPPKVPMNSLTLKTLTPPWMELLKTHRSKQF